MKPRNILVFGYFGSVTDQIDGQTVKTRCINKLIKANFKGNTTCADSQLFRYSIKAIVLFLRDLLRCNIVVWLPAHNNLKYLFPFIWVASKIFRFKIVYVVIGGWLSSILSKLPLHRKLLRSIKAILVENSTTISELRNKFDYRNVEILPNFREFPSKLSIRPEDGVFKMVFMARINRMKGLEIIEQCWRFFPDNVTIDFYGPINEEDSDYFAELSKKDRIYYRGCLHPDKIVSVLSQYDCLILPTRYYTEGFPGSILDAYRAGIPVIATEWKHAREFITNGETGYIVDFDNPVPAIVDRVTQLANSPSQVNCMKRRAFKEAYKYSEEEAWIKLSKYL